MKKTDLIQIKGLRDGLLILLEEADWDDLYPLLLTQIDERAAFFKGARLALNVGSQSLRVAEMVALRDALSERQVSLWAVLSDSPSTVQTAQLLGLATRISKSRAKMPIRAAKAGAEGGAMWVERTLRSGTSVKFGGHVVVMGDVNPGAEIVADGNILVWGRLRGAVHAGAGGDASAFACALEMLPSRLRIADQILNPIKKRKAAHPEKISLADGQFRHELWQFK
ncbi:MAG: septum site-determining protein MinC, partial [Anaerolineales bacterium]|nr:septum site-determining protein MinC [Anaerolineales bacterium]